MRGDANASVLAPAVPLEADRRRRRLLAVNGVACLIAWAAV